MFLLNLGDLTVVISSNLLIPSSLNAVIYNLTGHKNGIGYNVCVFTLEL